MEQVGLQNGPASPRAVTVTPTVKVSVGNLVQAFSPASGPASPARSTADGVNKSTSPRSAVSPPVSPRVLKPMEPTTPDKSNPVTVVPPSPRSPHATYADGGAGAATPNVPPVSPRPAIPPRPSTRSPMTVSAPSVDRPRSQSGGASPRSHLPAPDSIVRSNVAGDTVVATSGEPSSGEDDEEAKNESDGSVAEKNEKDPQGGTGPNAVSPRSGKDGEWKRKALAGKGIVREGGAQPEARVKLTSLLNSIETDRVYEPKTDTWKTKALTGRGIIPTLSDFAPSNPSTSPPSSAPAPSLVTSHSLFTPASAVPTSPHGLQSTTSVSLAFASVSQKSEDNEGSGGSGKKGSTKKSKEKRLSRKEEKKKNKDKIPTTAVSLPTTVVNRVHVDKDSLAQDMDGVLRALHSELARLGDHHPNQTTAQRGGLRRHRRSKSIDHLTSIITPKHPDAKTEASDALEKPIPAPAKAMENPDPADKGNQPPGERKTKTNSMRQQLLLGKGVVNDKRTVPVSRLSVLIDLADIQSENQQMAGRSHTPSPGLALLNSMNRPSKEDLMRQRLKTVKAVIASAMDEIQTELVNSEHSSCTDEEKLLILGTKLNLLNELLA